MRTHHLWFLKDRCKNDSKLQETFISIQEQKEIVSYSQDNKKFQKNYFIEFFV